MRFKIVELFNTRYFYLTTARDLNYMLSVCTKLRTDASSPYNVGSEKLREVYEAFKVGATVEFDLADAVITTDAFMVILNFYHQGLDFVDTEDDNRNKILLENKRRRELKETLHEVIPLPIYDVHGSAYDYIANLSSDVIYEVPATSDKYMIPLVTLICIYRPTIKLLLNNLAVPIFRFVAKYLTIADLERWSEFYVITEEGISTYNRQEDLYIQQLGICTMEQAATVADFVPKDFGSVTLRNDVLFRNIAKDCGRLLSNIRANQPIHLSDILN